MEEFSPNHDQSIIYMARNELDKNEIYIGKTDRSLPERREEHEAAALKRDGIKFHEALLQTGFANWKWAILEVCAREKAFDREKMHIKQFAASSVEVLNTVHNKKNLETTLVLQPRIKRPSEPNAESDLYRREGKVLKPVINLTTNKEYRSLSDASLIENESKSTIRNSCNTGKILWNGSRYAWVDLEGKPALTEGHSTDQVIGPSAKKVKNLVTGKVFKSAVEAAKEHDVSQNAIRANAIGESALVKEKWVFCYLDVNGQEVRKDKHSVGLQKLEEDARVKYVAWHIKDEGRENLYRFKDLSSLAARLHLKNKSHVKGVCDGTRAHVENWRIAFADEQGNPILKNKHNEVAKKVIRRVICLDDERVFENLTQAGKHYKVALGQIGKCAAGEAKSVRCEDKKLRFAYSDEKGRPILTEKHRESLDTRGSVRLYHVSSGKVFNSLAAFCRATKVPIKRAKKALDGEPVDLMGHEFVLLED